MANDNRKVRYNFTLDPELKRQFEEEVESNDTKMSTVLGYLIAGYIQASIKERVRIEDN